MVDVKKVLSEAGNTLVAHWVSSAILAAGTAVVTYWGVISANWSWPAAIVFAMVMLAAGLVIRDRLAAKPKSEWTPFPPMWNAPLIEVFRQTYENETVVLDGKRFHECTFNSVLFVYDGTGRVELDNCLYRGNKAPRFKTKSPAIGTVITIMDQFKMLAGPLKSGVEKKDTPR